MATSHIPLHPCSWLLSQLPGLSEAEVAQWQQLGITTTAQLLQASRTSNQKQTLAAQLKLPLQKVRKWIAIAHLAQLPSVGCTHCGVLLHAGVASIAQLAQTPVQRLHAQLLRFYVAQLQRRDLCPTVEEVQVWIQEARAFARR
ncbi:MAG: DUF4332 domain-containing protein [Spirulina sp. SIO3F2]|nr:DUF4332 domain-containing protein [Spirulina sp. SIO3F2]